MTTDEAMEVLRELNDSDVHVLALVPDRLSMLDGDEECWSIYNVNATPTQHDNRNWRFIASADTPAAAIMAAKAKLEGE